MHDSRIVEAPHEPGGADLPVGPDAPPRVPTGLRAAMPGSVSGNHTRILVRGVNWLGDAVMSSAALMRLREHLPDAHIAVLGPAKFKDLWQHHPAANESIGFAPGESVFSVSQKLRRGNYDCALVLPNSPRSAIEVWLAGIPRRLGYSRPWRNWFLSQAEPTRPGHAPMHKRSAAEIKRLVAYPAATTNNPPTQPGADCRPRLPDPAKPGEHQIHEYLHLAAAAFGTNPEPLPPRLFVHPDEIEAATKKFGLLGTTKPICGLNAGAEYGPAKRWPAERFIAAAREIQNRTQCTWLILGGPGDAHLAAEISAQLAHHTSPITPHTSRFTHHNLAGRTSLRELCALLKLCRVLLTNDSGPAHVAAALDTPVVVPFGSTAANLTGPGLPGNPRHRLLQSHVPCSPCFRRTCPIDFRCMTGITVEQVVEAVLKAF